MVGAGSAVEGVVARAAVDAVVMRSAAKGVIAGTAVELDGEWTDAAGGIFWLSHRVEYPLGTGTELRVQVDALGEGTHRVTASITDSSGAIYSDTVEITVEHSQPRPYTW